MRILTGGMPSSRQTTSTLAPNYFYIHFVSFHPAVTISPPVTTWQVRSRKQGPRRDLNLKGHRSGLRSQIRTDFGHLPGAAGRGPIGYVIVSGGFRCAYVVNKCDPGWGVGMEWATLDCAVAGRESGPSPEPAAWVGTWLLLIPLGKQRPLSRCIKRKGFFSAARGRRLLDNVDGINHLGYGHFMPTAAKLDPECSLPWLSGSGRVKASSQWATVSPSENVDVKIFLF